MREKCIECGEEEERGEFFKGCEGCGGRLCPMCEPVCEGCLDDEEDDDDFDP